MHVDGFRFDLASILSRDAAGLYQVGSFVGDWDTYDAGPRSLVVLVATVPDTAPPAAGGGAAG